MRCDHDAEAPNELSVRQNDTLTFKSVDEATSWYLVQRAGVPERVQAESGLVPPNYVEVLVDRTHDDHAHNQEAEVGHMSKTKMKRHTRESITQVFSWFKARCKAKLTLHASRLKLKAERNGPRFRLNSF